MDMVATAVREPTRLNGKVRVAAIMQAGSDVFSARGYDAATMTEIAMQSGTAIGSLYRFFPSKEALADALLKRYAQNAVDLLARIEARAAGMSADELADAFVDFSVALQSQRSSVAALVDARSGLEDKRLQFRDALAVAVAGIVGKVFPHLTAAKAKVIAVAVLHILKGVSGCVEEGGGRSRMLLGEFQLVLRLYFASV